MSKEWKVWKEKPKLVMAREYDEFMMELYIDGVTTQMPKLSFYKGYEEVSIPKGYK